MSKEPLQYYLVSNIKVLLYLNREENNINNNSDNKSNMVRNKSLLLKITKKFYLYAQ